MFVGNVLAHFPHNLSSQVLVYSETTTEFDLKLRDVDKLYVIIIYIDKQAYIMAKDNVKVSTHLNDIGDDFSIGRKCLSVNRISAEFLRANDIGAV